MIYIGSIVYMLTYLILMNIIYIHIHSYTYIGEYMMSRLKKSLPQIQLNEFHNQSPSTSYKSLVDKYRDMVQWQLINTPGYLGALLSIFR